MPEVLCLIPASGQLINGVKRNLAVVGGQPLLVHAIRAAKSSSSINRIMLITNDYEIAEAARQHGAEVPFLQPEELAAPGTPLTRVFQWFLKELAEKQNYKPDIVVFVEPVHPFRSRGMLDMLVEVLEREQLESVFFASKANDRFWTNDAAKGIVLLKEEDVVRHQREPLFKELGGLGAAHKAEVVISGERVGKSVGIVPVDERLALVDIRSEFDVFLANQLFETMRKDGFA